MTRSRELGAVGPEFPCSHATPPTLGGGAPEFPTPPDAPAPSGAQPPSSPPTPPRHPQRQVQATTQRQVQAASPLMPPRVPDAPPTPPAESPRPKSPLPHHPRPLPLPGMLERPTPPGRWMICDGDTLANLRVPHQPPVCPALARASGLMPLPPPIPCRRPHEDVGARAPPPVGLGLLVAHLLGVRERALAQRGRRLELRYQRRNTRRSLQHKGGTKSLRK